MTNNIIPFPKGSSTTPTLEQDETAKKLIEGRESISTQISEDCFDIILNAFQQYRVYKNPEIDETAQKDLFALNELISAIIFRQNGLDHPFQEVIDNVIRVTDGEEVESVTFAPDFTTDDDEETKI